MLAKLDRIGRFVENLLLVGLLAGMMLISVGQIIAREVFETGFFWSGELVRLMVLWLMPYLICCRPKSMPYFGYWWTYSLLPSAWFWRGTRIAG